MKISLPDEDPKTIDVDVKGDKVRAEELIVYRNRCEFVVFVVSGFVVFLPLQMSGVLGRTDNTKSRLLNMEPGHSHSHHQSSSQMLIIL